MGMDKLSRFNWIGLRVGIDSCSGKRITGDGVQVSVLSNWVDFCLR